MMNDDFDPEDEFDVEFLPGILEDVIAREVKPSLWQRIKWLFKPPKMQATVVEEVIEEVDEDWERKQEVAAVIQAGLASVVWANRESEDLAPGDLQYIVKDVFPKDMEDGTYWILVRLAHRWGDMPDFVVSLHDLLERCFPLGDLTYTDYDA